MKWEYKVESIHSHQVEYIDPLSQARDFNGDKVKDVQYPFGIEQINELGKQGWEFCKVLSEGLSSDMHWPYFKILFKRQIIELKDEPEYLKQMRAPSPTITIKQ